jgi:DnaK suppressor protein
MSHIDLEQARQRLLAELEHLDRQFNEIDDERRAVGPIDKLTGDAGQDTARVDTELRQEAEIQTARRGVVAALQRVDDGTYGIDEETGQPIDPERLDALPTARGNIR